MTKEQERAWLWIAIIFFALLALGSSEKAETATWLIFSFASLIGLISSYTPTSRRR